MKPSAKKQGGSPAGVGRVGALALAAVAISSALAGALVTYRVMISRTPASAATAVGADQKAGPGVAEVQKPAAPAAPATPVTPSESVEVFSGSKSGRAFPGTKSGLIFDLPIPPGEPSKSPGKNDPTTKP
jgi:hypothetical protein